MEKLIASEKGTGSGVPCLPSSCGLISGATQTLWKLAKVAYPWVWVCKWQQNMAQVLGPAHPLTPGVAFQDLTWILFLNISFLFPYATMKTADVNKNSSCQCNTESTVCGYSPAAAFTAQYGTNTFPYLHCRLQLPWLAQEEWATTIKTSVPQNWELIF